MKAMILNIGAEVLSGKVVNTNAAFIGSELRKIGIETERIAVVGDNPDMIKNELVAFQNSSSKILITTGGLGPTHDDLTKEVICNFLGLKTEKREDPLKRLEEYFGGSFPEVNKKQAEFPKEALLLDNKIGTAPGAIIPYQDKIYILLVGPYTEMKLMFADSVLPYLQEISGKNINASEFTVMGKSESAFEENLSNLYRSYPDVNIASYPEEGKIRFVLQSTNFETYQEALGEFKKLMKDYIVSESGESIEEVVVGLLKNKGYKISVAESCTGGMLASLLVNVPGASEVFQEGFVTYANEAKMKYLGVRKETIAEYGVVSEPVVLEMISGLKRLNGAEVRIGISGIAGPGGGTKEKPVGLVHYAIGINDDSYAEAKIFKGNREQIRRKACLWVLYRLFLLLKAD